MTMARLRLLLLLVVGQALGGNVLAQETIRIGGTGIGTLLVQRILDASPKARPNIQAMAVSPPLGSTGGLRALAAGTIQIAVVSIPSTHPDNATNSDNSRSFPWVRTPFIFTGRGTASGAALTRDQVADIYAGRIVQWPGGEQIRLVIRTERDSETRLLRGMSPEIDAAVTLVRKRIGMPFAENDIDNQKLLEQTPASFGTIGLGQLLLTGSPLKPAVLDGVAPTPANLRAGSYRVGKAMYLVVAKAPSAATREFVEYLRSPAVLKLIERFGFIPMP
jgi:phosphate transport system substrate-binding protein